MGVSVLRIVFKFNNILPLVEKAKLNNIFLSEAEWEPWMRLVMEKEFPINSSQLSILYSADASDGADVQLLRVDLLWSGDLQTTVFEDALQQSVSRHAAFEIGFVEKEDGWAQIRKPDIFWTLKKFDKVADPVRAEEGIADLAKPLDIANPPLFRCGLVREAPGVHRIVLVFHHLIGDRLSIQTFVTELAEIYTALLEGYPASLSPAPGYEAAMQRQLQRFDNRKAPALDYWEKNLAGTRESLDLGIGRTPIGTAGSAVQGVEEKLPEPLARTLRQSAASVGVSLQVMVLSAFGAALGRLSGPGDVVVGVPVSAREEVEDEKVFGFLVNTIPVRLPGVSEDPFLDTVSTARDRFLDGYEHQYVPLGALATRLGRSLKGDTHPVFHAVFAWAERFDPVPVPGAQIRLLPPVSLASPFDLSMLAGDEADGLRLGIEYAPHRLTSAEARVILEGVIEILKAAADNPMFCTANAPLSKIDDTRHSDRADPVRTAPVRLKQAIETWPDRLAVVCEHERLTYRELGQRSSWICARLKDAGIGCGDAVAVLGLRDAWLPPAMIAVMQSGATLVMIDPEEPAERRNAQLDLANVKLVLGTEAALAANKTRLPVLVLHATERDLPEGKLAQPEQVSCRSRRAPAYVIFTSGSTGQPKPVLVSHEALANHLDWAINRFALTPQDRVLQFCSPAFDAALEEILPALSSGAALVLRSAAAASGVQEFVDFCEGQQVSVADLPTGFWNQAAQVMKAEGFEIPSHLRLVCIGGEAFLPEAVQCWRALTGPRAQEVELLNSYGPTEAAIVASAGLLESETIEAGDCPTIGDPIPGIAFHILDDWMHPVPQGVAGELYIAGRGVAEGYLGRSAQTAERFLPDPFSNVPGARMYRTGDRVRRADNGNLQYFGRTDRQLKVRGFRVDPAEIERALLSHPQVRAAFVWLSESQGAGTLAAVVEAGPDVTIAAVAAHVEHRLPAFMRPISYAVTERLPRTARGKPDLAAMAELLKTAQDDPSEMEFSDLERDLVDIWANQLDLPVRRLEDNFWDLGGHSLSALMLLSAIKVQHGVRLTVRDLMNAGSIRALAALIDEATPEPVSHVTPSPFENTPRSDRNGERSLVPAERAIWLDDQLHEGPSPYIITEAFRIQAAVSADRLQNALHQVASRNPVLRSIISMSGDEPIWKQGPDPRVRRVATGQEGEGWLEEILHDPALGRFDLGIEPPLRLFLVESQISEDSRRQSTALVVQFHHICVDDVAIQAFLLQLSKAYAGEPHPDEAPGSLFDQLKDEAGVAADHSAWWKGYLENVPASINLPVEAAPLNALSAQAHPMRVSVASRKAFFDCAAEHGSTPFVIALALTFGWLSRMSRQAGLAVAVPVSERDTFDDDAQIALQSMVLPVRCVLEARDSLSSLVSDLRSDLAAILDHRGVSLAAITSAVRQEVGTRPYMDVLFDFQDKEAWALPDFAGAPCEPVPVPIGTARSRLEISFIAAGEQVAVELRGRADAFNEGLIDAWANSLAVFSATVLADQRDRPLIEIPLTLPGTGISAGAGFAHQDKAIDIPDIRTRFRRTAANRGQAVAVVERQTAHTYEDLAASVRVTARWLMENGLGGGQPIGLVTPRAAVHPAALLGIWEAGSCAVLIDPAQPLDRVRGMLETVPVAAALTGRIPDGIALLLRDVPRLDLSAGLPQGDAPWPPAPPEYADRSMAYVAFTSGSTGRPKAVACTHKGLANLLNWSADEIALHSTDALLHLAAPGFDIALWEGLHPLLCGAKLVVLEAERHGDIDHIISLVEKQHISVVHFVPSLLAPFLEALREEEGCGIRALICGGEAFLPSLYEAARDRLGAEIHHTYGPTEAAVFCLRWRGDGEGGHKGRLPLGYPLANMAVFIADDTGAPLPKGAIGEICVTGASLALGYVRNSKETAARFPPCPDGMPGSRFYRTGDLGRLRADGQIEFHGRIDRQLKISGVRIEPAEIEDALRRCPGVLAAAVEPVMSDAGQLDLAAYIAPAPAEPSERQAYTEDVRRSVQKMLPSAMMPRHLVPLTSLPLTPNGKVDRKALSLIPLEANASSAAVEALSQEGEGTEAALVRIWSSVLGHQDIGLQTNFFACGGDSITAIRVASRARAQGLPVQLADLFRHPTVEALTGLIAGRAEANDVHAASAGRGPFPPSPIQSVCLGRGRDSVQETIDAQVIISKSRVDADRLSQALNSLVRAHEALRQRLNYAQTGAQIIIADPDENVSIPVVINNVRHLDGDGIGEALSGLAGRVDLERGPVLATAILRGEDRDQVLLAVHHFAVDWLSWRVLCDDLEEAYQSGGHVKLPPVACPYSAWLAEYRRLNEAGQHKQDVSVWRSVCGTGEPCGQGDEGRNDEPGGNASFLLERKAQKALSRLAREMNGRLGDLVLAASAWAVAVAYGRDHAAFMVEGHGRLEAFEGIDLSRTVGWLTVEHPLRVTAADPEDPRSWVRAVSAAWSALPQSKIGYGLLRRDGALSGFPEPCVGFNFLGEETGTVDGDDAHRQFTLEGVMPGTLPAEGSHKLAIEGWSGNDGLALSVEWASGNLAATAGIILETLEKNLLALAREAPEQLEIPMTPLQEGMLAHELSNKRTGAYHTQIVFELHGNVDRATLREAWERVASAHAAFRTAFVWEERDRPMQFEVSGVTPDWRQRRSDDATMQEVLETVLEEDRGEPFDLHSPPLSRCWLLEAEERKTLVWSHHHILFDGWSLPLVSEALGEAYDQALSGSPSRFLDAGCSFAEFVDWWQSQDKAGTLDYWRKALSGAKTPCRLTSAAALAGKPARHTTAFRKVGAQTAAGLKRVAAASTATLHSVVAAAWGLFIGRTTGRRDALFGMIVSLRPPELPGIEKTVGLCMNTVPMRVQLGQGTSIQDLLLSVQSDLAGAIEHATAPLSAVLMEGLEAKAKDMPFDTLLVFENYPGDKSGTSLGPDGRLNVSHSLETTEFPLVLVVMPQDTGMALELIYDTRATSGAQAERTLDGLSQILDTLASITLKEH